MEPRIGYPKRGKTQTLSRFEVQTQGVATLTLGSWPRQGVGRWRAKRKTRESFHMPLRVQRVWGHEPSHSQVNSHVGSWNPERTSKSSKRNCKGQNSSPWSVLYIIGKILKFRCLKWAHIAHLDINKQVMAKRMAGNQIGNLTPDQ
jgi:hypothetical protein